MARERQDRFSASEEARNGQRKITWVARVHTCAGGQDPIASAGRRIRTATDCSKLLKEYDQTAGAARPREDVKDLADHYKAFPRSRVYDGRKVSGLRSLATVQGQLNTLKGHFGKRPVRSLTHGDIRGFRGLRLKTPTRADVARH